RCNDTSRAESSGSAYRAAHRGGRPSVPPRTRPNRTREWSRPGQSKKGAGRSDSTAAPPRPGRRSSIATLEARQTPHHHVGEIVSHVLPQDGLLVILRQQQLLGEREAAHI